MLFHQHGPGKKGIAGIPVTSLHPAHFLYQGWNSYWLRWIAQGKEVYFAVARTKPEMVLIGEVLTQIRNQAPDIVAAATNCHEPRRPNTGFPGKESCSQGTCTALS